MIDAKKIELLSTELQRICAMPMAKSTLRQMQNAILFLVEGNKDLATRMLESFMSGDNMLSQSDCSAQSDFDALIKRFSVSFNIARDVAERGEFIGMVTSDIINHPQVPMLGNRFRKIGGEEFEFLTDVPSTLQLMNHFCFRLDELDKMEKSKNVLKGMKKELTQLRDQIDKLLAGVKE